MSEPELLHVLDQGCNLCGEVATRVRSSVGYCPSCYAAMRVLGTEQAVLALARKVALHRL